MVDEEHSGSIGGLGDDDDIRSINRGQANTDMTTGQPTIPAVGKPKLVRIVIDETDNMPPNGQPIGYNGVVYNLRAGIEYDVPEGVVGILNDARVRKPQVDPQTLKVVGYREVLRIPYRRV